MSKNLLKKAPKVYEPHYAEKTTFFADKEIIFRSQGRAKVFTISSRIQVIFLCLLLGIGMWSFYSYHMYNRSGVLISVKDKEIDETRDAYVQLMTDFVALHKNIDSLISNLDAKKNANSDIDLYKRQAMVVEDKIKQITSEKDWLSTDQIEEKISLNEALLQRDIASSERDELKKQLNQMANMFDDLRNAEMEVLDRVEQVTAKEMSKIKSAFNNINVPIKRRGLYFNPLANKKGANTGGPYIPAPKIQLQDKKINDKISAIFEQVGNLEYYKEVAQYVPLGKPVWSYWVTSHYGSRSDPFNGKSAAHKGVDLASRSGNKIKAQAKGKVTRAEYAGGYGNLVVLDHGNGFQTKYAHMKKIYVKKGDYVEIDDTLGEVGTTGRSTGPHLHYEVLYRGHDVDPMPFIKAKLS